MYLIKTAAILTTALSFARLGNSQQYAGDVIPNSLPNVPGSEVTYFRVNDPSGANKNLTLINYYSHGKSTSKRLVESNVQRAVVIIHGLNRDPGTYMSNMLSALAQVKSDPNVNFDTVAIMAPYFPNGDDKGKGYPWTEGLKPGKGSTSNALVWKSSQWSAGANNQYPSTSKNISSYTVLDQIVQYFDNRTLFPQMKQIVIAGHSLGAQTVQRYAAIGVQLNTKSPVSYWCGNPNSYAWLSSDRPLSTAGCSAYDEYRDGYAAFEEYPMTYGVGLVASGRGAIQANFNSKAINYGRGTQDLGDDSSSCGPRTTGKDRNERFFNFIKAFPPSCPDPAGRNCDTVDFVNIGHDGGSMMASAAGQARLFLDNFYGDGNRSYDFGYPRQQAGDDPYPNPGLNGTTGSINNNTYAGNMTYWGCWSDQYPQTLTNMTYQNSANTVEACTQACASGNNTIAGMEFGTQCFCGSSLGYRAQQVIESSCQTACPGNSTQKCGGSNRVSLFSNGRPQLQPTPGTPETVGNFTYISCYTETSTGRALGAKSRSTKNMTLEYCADYCSGYKYFGTEYGSECYCGNSFGAGANRTSDDDCNMLCANDVSEFCGAGNRLTVYQNDDFVVSSSAVTSSIASSTSQPGSQITAVSCPTSNNSIITSGGKTFTIECGIDHQGGDLTSLNVNNFQQCIDACAHNGRCVDVSLSGNACYLKSALGAAVSNGGIWGAKLVTDTSSSSSATPSSTAVTSSGANVATSSTVTSPGATLSSTSTTSSSAMPSSILTTTSALTTSSRLTSSSAITTSDGQTSTTSSSRSASASASSTPVACPGSDNTTIVSNGVTFEIECGVDHFGGDMKSLSVSSFQQCIDACATTSGCVNVALSGAACYLKRTLGVAINNGVWGAKAVQLSATSTSSAPINSGASTTSSTSVTNSASVTSDQLTNSDVTTTSEGSSSISSASTSSSVSTSSSSSGEGATTSSSATSIALTSLTSIDSASTSTSISSSTGSTSSPSPGTSSDSTPPNFSSSSSGSSSSSSSVSFSSSTWPSSLSTSQYSDSFSSSTATLTTSQISSLPLVSSTSSMTPTSITPSTSTLSSTQSSTTSSAQSPTSNTISSTSLSSSAPITASSSSTSTTVSTSPTFSSSSSTASAALPTGFTSLGCFVDGNTRALPQTNGSSSAQTPQQCALNCQSRGFKYSGTEYGQECWCGSAPPQSSASAPTSQCNMRCSGDKGQMCGASNRISVVMDNDWKQTFFARHMYSTWSLMGCYVDTNAARTLSKTVSLTAYGGGANATIANCMKACRSKGYQYCGQEYYSECYGSNISPPETRLANGADLLTAGCNYPCNGNKTEACGGSGRILVYVNNGTA